MASIREQEIDAIIARAGKSDALITWLVKGDDHLYIKYSPSREIAVKEVYFEGKLQAHDRRYRTSHGTYRAQIKSSIKWGWTVASSSELDLLPAA
ncbi:hypothetical protein WKI65_44225 [Streptomyces sp. MS1.AVA.3]|uniref:hypothetical protein n=1 Tax=Streptomyces decoyicus TaxID=249567 RepID=UPI0030BCDF90